MPALFISHGSPMNMMQDNAYTRDLKKLGQSLLKPKAALVVSAHWMSDAFVVSAEDEPETIHDFYGFPDELYLMSYETVGAPEIAKRAAEMTTDARIDSWGLDHGAWGVLHFLFPERDVPAFQFSVNRHSTYEKHYGIGELLAPLREEGVMIIGSGNATHNLRDIRRDIDAPVELWTKEFSETFTELVRHDPRKLTDPQANLPHFSHAHPTPDHYLPLLPVLGSKREDETVTFFHQSTQYGTLDMSCFLIA